MTTSLQIQKWGNSQGIRLPKYILNDIKWSENEEITLKKGFILCQHVKALDLKAHQYKVIEKLPNDILNNVINIVFSEIEII